METKSEFQTEVEKRSTVYACLVHLREEELAGLSPEAASELNRDSIDYDESLKRRGKYVTSAALQAPDTATVVRMKGEKVIVTDGPFAEMKEQIGGFILIRATDLNEAIRIASKIPVARFGCVEIRPLHDMQS